MRYVNHIKKSVIAEECDTIRRIFVGILRHITTNRIYVASFYVNIIKQKKINNKYRSCVSILCQLPIIKAHLHGSILQAGNIYISCILHTYIANSKV